MKGICKGNIPSALFRFNSACMNKLLRRKGGKGKSLVTVAFDEHDILRYDRKDRDCLVKTRYDKGTAYRERHMVALIVDTKNVHKKNEPSLFLGSSNVMQGYNKFDFVRKTIQFCLDQNVKVDLVLLDRGFSVDIINTIVMWV